MSQLPVEHETWAKMVTSLLARPDLPDWAAAMISEAWAPLQTVGSNSVVLEEKVIEPDYVEFLERQSSFEGRGPEWKALMQVRRDALAPYIGKALVWLTLKNCGKTLSVRFARPNMHVVHMEEW